MANLSPQALAALGRNEDGFRVSENNPSQSTPSEATSPVYQFDNYDGSHPVKIADDYQLSLYDICAMISERFRCIFRNYSGCCFTPSPNGVFTFSMCFSPGVNNPQTGSIPPIESIKKLFDRRNQTSNAPRNSNAEFADVHFTQIGNGRRTMTLTDEAKNHLNRFMQKVYDRSKDKFIHNWDDCIKEGEIQTQNVYAPTETVLLLFNIDLIKVLNSIMIPNKYIFEDEARAIIEYMNNNKIPTSDENMTLYSSTSKFYEIYDKLKVRQSFTTGIVYKGYRSIDPYNNISYNPNPYQPVTIPGAYPEFKPAEYYVNLTVIDLNVVKSIIPKKVQYQRVGNMQFV